MVLRLVLFAHNGTLTSCSSTLQACGFELLVCSAGGVTPVSTPSDPSSNDINTQLDLSNNPRWLKYRQSLADKGYFRVGVISGPLELKEYVTASEVYELSICLLLL